MNAMGLKTTFINWVTVAPLFIKQVILENKTRGVCYSRPAVVQTASLFVCAGDSGKMVNKKLVLPLDFLQEFRKIWVQDDIVHPLLREKELLNLL